MKKIVFVLIFVIQLSLLPGTAFAANDQPFTLAAPNNLTAELKYDFEEVPYFELKMEVPQSAIDVNSNILSGYYSGINCDEVTIQFDYKYGDYDWNKGESFQWSTSIYLYDFTRDGYYDYYPWGKAGPAGDLDIKAEVYQFRAYFFSGWGYEGDWMSNTVRSDYSNTVTIGNTAYYSGASNWAKAGLDKALEYGFITDRIRDKMNASITREEFAEVAVKVYEKYTGKAATYKDMSAFTDTQNPEIFKAAALKIVSGIGNNKFSPNTPITRDQMATMLYNLVKAIAPDVDYSTAGAPVFADQKTIPGWALEFVKFMSKNGFITGIDGKFEPSLTSTREQAVYVAVKVYEYYL